MKKFLAIVLAVICIFSMATVAFAADSYLPTTKVCAICGASTTNPDDYNAHLSAGCGKCAYCETPWSTKEELENHQHNYCLNFAGKATCDYCGAASESTEAAFDAHVEECKAKYFNIPLAKIIATVKDILSKIDFEQVIGTVKSLAEKVAPAIQDLIGKIGK